MNNWINLYLQETLDKERIKLLPYFEKIKNMWFYLAWWTALALIFWHRKSVDFDFFIKWWFDENKLFLDILDIFKKENIVKTFSEKNTLYVEVNGVKISFFGYDYDLIWEKIETKYFEIASLQDIWTMKLWAIQKRATNKDYVDLYYILQKISLDDLIKFFYKKYGKILSEYIILKSLVYFDDIKNDELIFTDKQMNFEKIKKGLEKIVKNYENKLFRN